MEDDGQYPEDYSFNWTYEDVPPNTPNINYAHYNGHGPCLKPYVHKKFDNLLGACGTA